MRFSANCTWGDGPAVLLTITEGNCDPYYLVTHTDGSKSIGLSRRETLNLALSLIAAYDTASENEINAANWNFQEMVNKVK